VRQPNEDAEAVLLVSKDDDKRVQFRHVVIRFSFYILVFFVCWFFDVITYFILFFNDNCNVYAFTFGYTLFRNLQVRAHPFFVFRVVCGVSNVCRASLTGRVLCVCGVSRECWTAWCTA
jgi:hypothetical protein